MSAVMSGCGSSGEQDAAAENTAVLVEASKPETGDLILKNDFVGSITPNEQVMVLPLVSGEVTEVFFEVGDAVQAGDVLFTIDDEVARMQLEQAQIGVKNAQVSKEAAELGEQNAVITQQQAALGVESAMQQAQAQLETQQQLTQQQQQSNLDQLQQQIDALYIQRETYRLQLEALYKQWGDLDEYHQPTYAVENQVAQMRKTIEGIDNQIEAAKKSLQDTSDTYVKQNTEVYEETRQQLANQIVNSQYAEQQAGVGVGTAKQQVENAQVGVENAQKQVESALLQLSYYTVTAPISGVIDTKNVDVHGFASSGNVAYVISDKDTMTVSFQVSESVKNTLAVGDELTVERSGVEYTGTITEIGIAVNQQTGLFAVKAAVKANGTELPSGVMVTVTADTYAVQDSLLVPYSSIYYEGGKAYLYVMRDGVAVKTYVETGIFDEEYIVIESGITAEDYCITSWSPQLANGVEVYTADGK